MTPERWKEVEELYHAVLARPEIDREEFLRQAAGNDLELRAEVDALVREHVADPDFLAEPVVEVGDTVSDLMSERDDAVRRVGPYQLIRTLAVGGMGEVFLASRTLDGAPFLVALKVVRSSIAGDELTTRFGRERAILARLHHPNIGRFLDGGLTQDDKPFFAMEYVDGLPITEYCTKHRLDLNDRLDLFRQVCTAVHYAHQNLVVHRDIKPGNILVISDGTPKLLDFGIAKLLEPDEQKFQTRTGARLLTPDYASPEQLRGIAISTSTDIYSLGILLYELLTGRRPFDLADLSPGEVERIVSEQFALRPSEAINRSDDDGSWRGARVSARVLRGDLDTIVLKALQKEPERRYVSAEQFGEDIRRYQAGLPIVARPDTVGYRVAKFVRRHRVGVGAAVALILLLVIATGVTAMQSSEIRRKAAEVSQERDRVERVVDLLTGLYRSAEPNVAKGEDPTLREVLDREAKRLRSEARQDPDIQAEMLSVIAGVYNSLGLRSQADSLHAAALDLRREHLGADHPAVASSLDNLGEIRRSFGDYEEAEALYQQALAVAQRSGGAEEEIHIRHHLGFLYHDTGDYDRAEEYYRQALDLAEIHFGDRHRVTARITHDLAWVLEDSGDLEEAGARYRGALDTQLDLFGEYHTDAANTLNNLGWLLRQRGELDEAEPLLRRALEIRQRLLGKDHQQYGQSATALGLLMKDQQNYAEAIPLLEEALGVYTRALGAEHSYVAAGFNNLGTTFRQKGDLARAEHYLRRALAVFESVFGEDHPNVAASTINLAHVLKDQGKLDEAVPFFEKALDIDRRTLGETHHYVGDDLAVLASVAVLRGDLEKAETLYLAALSIYDNALPDGNPSVANARLEFATVLSKTDRHDEAVAQRRRAVDILRRSYGSDDSRTASAEIALGGSLIETGDLLRAESLFVAARSALERLEGDFSLRIAAADSGLAAIDRARSE